MLASVVPLQTVVEDVVQQVPTQVWLAVIVLAVGVLLGYVAMHAARRLLVRFSVPAVIEGTTFERTANDIGTSTVAIIAQLVGYFVFIIAVIAALTVAEVDFAVPFWNSAAAYVPRVFLAAVVVVVGVVVGDKVELLIAERLRGVKLPQVGVIPAVGKYSVFYVAALIALSQLGVATLALLILLAAYLFAVVLFTGIALFALLSSSAAGAYLLLNQPYGIGDRIRVGDRQGIVQEMDLFVTHVENDGEGEEYIIPNRRVFEEGVVRIRS
jgi:small-conductance mechanosensitive channel